MADTRTTPKAVIHLGGVGDREPLNLGWSEWIICHTEGETSFNANQSYGCGETILSCA